MERRGLSLLVTGVALLMLAGSSALSDARVEVGVSINIPAYRFAAPPPLVVIPGTYAYVVPDIDVEVLFYHGLWYRPYEGRWFRSRAYNGPWVFVEPTVVPRVLLNLPPDYRHVPHDYRRIPYREFHKNWRSWEKNRYWERDERWRRGRHEDRGHDRRDYRHGDRHDDRMERHER